MSPPVTSASFHKSKTLNNKYIFGEEIGKGAFGKVYKGLDLENGDFVAIKQVSLQNIGPEQLSVIMQEIDLLKNLHHKNIVKYLGSVKTKTNLHIILEYVENGSLANIIKPNKFGPFPESLVAVYIAQVLEGLVYLHEQGVIHRDIKGANILATKEGLVKLADFGVATKLPDGLLRSQTVAGTPYWMAPEVIEMSGVCAASDIWSVGCTVIELLTCIPPYFDVNPMAALYRIVTDECPPIPDNLSPAITDFLHQCFNKDPRQRPGAKTLLSHPWIKNSRRALRTKSLHHSGTLRNIEEVGLVDAESSNSRQGHSVEASSTEKLPRQTSARTNNYDDQPEVLTNGDEETHESARRRLTSRKFYGKESSVAGEHVKPNFAQKSKDQSPRKSVRGSINSEGNELTRFSDQPGDTSPLNGRAAEASKSSSSLSHVNRVNIGGNSNLATKLRATIAQKKMQNESSQANGGGDLLSLVMGVLKEDEIEEKLHEENLLNLQAVEFSKLVSSLRSDAPEDVIVSACQNLTISFHQRPDHKIVFIRQHGLLPLVELLDVRRPRVISCILQVLNQLIKDNADFQENACLVGLVPIVMNLAMPDRPMEIRTEAAYFFQQLCQSSLLTLQMFIVCHGIYILVGFLEADYAEHWEMVHIAIDGMWQVLKLQKSTSRNDFCRIAAKNGILVRLINSLYSLNEAARLAPRSRFRPDGIVPRPFSSRLDSTNPSFMHMDTSYGTDRPDLLKASSSSKVPNSASLNKGRRESVDRLKNEPSRSDDDIKQRRAYPTIRISADKATKSVALVSNGSLVLPNAIQQKNGCPPLKLLDKEPPSRHVSGQLEYVRHLTRMALRESSLPLLRASSDKKTNRLEFLKTDFPDISGRRRENSNMDSLPRSSHKAADKNLAHLPSNGRVSSSLGLPSPSGSGVLSGSGILHARPGSSTSSGLLSYMMSPWNVDVAREYLEKVADLLLEFAVADSGVKLFMCSKSFLSRLFEMFNKIEPPILLKLLKCINHLSTDPNCLENLQQADAIKHLIPNLDLKEGLLVSLIHQEVLSALFNLCKISKRRQDQAAEYGIIPRLMQFIMSDSPFRRYALPLLFDMAHASRKTREQLRAHGGLDVFLSLLEDESWCVTALDSVAICLALDNEDRKVEQVLIKKGSVKKLVKFFRRCPEQHFLRILEPFLKIITRSPKLNTTLAVNGLTPLLITRLDNPDAIARLSLLRMIKVVYEHHPRPKQMIVENNLPRKLENLIQERRDGQSYGGQVLVKQLATSLLKALHFNTVF